MEDNNDNGVGAESKTKSLTKNKVSPVLTLVLVGETNSIEIGPKNILLNHEKQANVEQFSSKLYDLCGRHISVINMLGLQHINKVILNQEICAFLLMLPYGLHNSHYSSGTQQLEKVFGKESLSYLMTVVTHEPGDKCDSALSDLKANSSFAEKRFHTCRRCMMDENEILDLLEKIDVMITENDHHSRHEQQREYPDHKSSKEKGICNEETENTADNLKCDPLNEHGVAEQSQKNDGRTGGEGKFVPMPAETKKKGSSTMDVSKNNSKSVNTSEEINNQQSQSKTEILLKRLNLHDAFQQKMSPADFLKIGPPVKHSLNTSEKYLACAFLQSLITLDYKARYIPVRQENPNVSCSQSLLMSDSDETDALFIDVVDSDKSIQSHIHPMDVQMAVFHCSDNFLKQNLITKLSQCQYALPLLVPDPVTMDIECPLWTFRQITKTWKITQIRDNSNVVTMKTMPVCKAKTPMVLFFRLGLMSVSKSQLMNTLINDRHSTFFDRNSPGSTKSRHLMDGVVEIAWYCPAGKPNDSFTDCIAFCNLHGDALSFEKQREILTEKSSVNIVLVQTLEKGQKNTTVIQALYKSPKPLIVLIAENDHCAVMIKDGKYKLGLKDRSQSDVSKELKAIIGEIVSGPYTFQLESMAKVPGVRVDENNTVCKKGKSAAMKTVNLLQGMEISNIKDTFLPCQGDLWHNWCRINKELHHLKGNIEKEKCQRQKQLVQIRHNQCKASCSKLMKSFTKSLLSLPSKEKEYFLKWTQILIDDLSTDDLSSILQSYNEKWTEVLTLKKKHDKSDLLSKQTELEEISKKLQSATFGLEHIFREMGQIYEAHREVQAENTHGDWAKYPELAADLMILGHPVELMDGDAGHVPLTWISSLLDEVIKKLGDQNIFVLSVLGLQSSGKSTMLNAMFGLQFAVSAGRCTKGAFMQLVKVSEEIKKLFQFDYVLVVDTEGLRALELAGNATLHHDNELATFVVGLGNMTLINIFGENPAEMQDILQIVVQAFMRMKKVKLSPSCVFVHQNVTDIAAAERNMDGKRRLQEKLDQMAQLAAKEELCDAECFSDVIAFDVQTDVKYFAQLWEGSPPMAPPNPGYSESIQELKNVILSKAERSAGVKLSYFKSKIHDLWKALMNEQFVFSFKNTLEIEVYRRLEVQYCNWTWALRSNMLTIENEFHTRIENGKLDKVECRDLFKELNKKYKEVEKDMIKYFEDDRDNEMLVQWRGQFENKIKEFQEELVKGVRKKLDEVIEQKKACKKLDDKKSEFENKLLQKSKELAHQLKDKATNEEELKKLFDGVWSHWVKELIAGAKPIEDIKLEDDQANILHILGFEWSPIIECKTSGRYKKIPELGDYSGYLFLGKQQDTTGNWITSQVVTFLVDTGKKIKRYFRGPFEYKDQEQIRSLIKIIEKQSLDAIHNKPVATKGYNLTYLQEMAKNVQETVTEFESSNKCTFKKEFTVDLLLYLFDQASSWLKQSHKKFTEKNDARTYLESKKVQYYNIFSSFCKGNTYAVVFGEMICEKLKVSIVQAAYNKAAIALAEEMRCTFPAFSGNRLNLEKYLLKSLAEKEEFDAFITYIKNPRKQVEAFITEKVNTYIFRDSKDEALNILSKNVENIYMFVCQALFDATNKVKTQRGDIDMWVDQFSSFLKSKLTLDTITCQNFGDINNFDFLREEIERGLKSVTKEVSQVSLDKMKEIRMRPDQILIDQLCNCCWDKCPFCAAVCTNTIKDHNPDDHSAPFHRSQAVDGWHYSNTLVMCVDFCTTNVSSNGNFYPHSFSQQTVPFKKYRTAGPPYENWRITPDESKLKYWTWFVCRFKKELEKHYGYKFVERGSIPEEWEKHTKEQAIQSLDEMYKL